ncbi:MAG: hypothetical protein ABH872_01750 [Candidatus Omnitrophota bacterium]
MQSKVSIIFHPVSRKFLFRYEPGMKRLPIEVAKRLLELAPPFRAAVIEGIKSEVTGEVFNGDFVMCSLLTEQMLLLNPRRVLNRVVKAAKFAKDSHASLICLVAYAAFVGQKGKKVMDRVGVPVTNGLHMTVAVIPEALFKSLAVLGVSSRNLKVFAFGANAAVDVVVRQMGSSCSTVYVFQSSADKRSSLSDRFSPETNKKAVITSTDPKYILKDMDIVINATNRHPVSFKEEYLKKGAIVFDASYPRSISIEREDIFLIDGLAMEPPGKPKFNCYFGLDEGLCYPCMSEAITLAFEGRFEPYTLGKDLFSQKAISIFQAALKHGFRIGPLTSHEEVISLDKIQTIKNSLKRKGFISVNQLY